ncbi:hypothetical protein KQI84_00515 [bacterium]|nr:hypothetical protein [bacterium]
MELQELDREMIELQEQLNQYPGIWEEVKATLRAKQDEFDQADAAAKSYHGDRRRIEQELRLSSEKLKKYQVQQMQVKTSKEYGAISNQIEALRKNIQRLEEQGLELINQEQAIKDNQGVTEKALGEAKADARTERERIREQVNDKKKRLNSLQKDRDKVAAKVDDEALRLYERIRNRWPLDPVVGVRNGSCMGCHYAILPNPLVALHKDAGIETCENCGRILSEDETYEAEKAEAEAEA